MNEPPSPDKPNLPPSDVPPPLSPPSSSSPPPPPPSIPTPSSQPPPAPAPAPVPPAYSPPPPPSSTPPPAAGVPPTASVPPAKKSVVPWVLGGCGCLLLLLILAGVIGYGVYRTSVKVAKVTSEIKGALPDISVTPASPGASRGSSSRAGGTKTYINAKDKLPARLQPNFVAFSFDYPSSFVLQPQGEINFVKVEQYTSAGPGNTSENFAVGSASFTMPSMPGGMNDLFGSVIYDQLLDQLGQQFARGFHNYKEVKKVNETVAGIKCRASLFQADLNDPAKTMVYGKTIVVHPPGKDKGVTIIMLATSLDPDIESPADLGVKGEGAAILRSFRLL